MANFSNSFYQRFCLCFIFRLYQHALDIRINEEKTRLGRNKFDFLGFKIKKKGSNAWIKIKDEAKIRERVKKFTFRSLIETDDFLKWLRGILNYFDITNDMADVLNCIERRLFFRNKRGTSRSILSREQGSCNYKYSIDKGRFRVINIYELRKSTKISFKEYNLKSSWIRQRELLKNMDNEQRIYLWALFTRQRGLNPITKEKLKINDLIIHHIKPKSKGGNDSLENLILIDSEKHKQIHGKEKCNAEIEKYRKHLR